MKLSFYTCFILFIAVFFSHNAFSEHILDVQVNLSKSRLLNKRVFGIHAELLWSPIRLGDPLLSSIYNDIGFQDIRLPGGAAGNHYLSQTEKFGCNKTGIIGEKTLERIKKYNIALSRGNRTYSTLDFLSFIKQAKTDFTLIINVLCDTPENTGKWMEKIRDSGVIVKYAEMGSEYYFEEYLWAFPSPVDYIKQAEKHTLEVRKIFPDVEIGVDTSSSSYRSKNFPDFSRMIKNKRYKRGLAYDKLAASALFADAFIIHIYSPIGTTWGDEVLNTINNARAYKNAVSYFDGRIIPSMQYFHKLKSNKKIWISEWGTAFYGWRRKHEASFLRTYYNALYVTNGLLTYFTIPYIESTNYHNFPNLWSDFKKLETNPLYYAMSLFKKPMKQTYLISPVNLKGAMSYTGTYPNYKGDSPELNSVLFHNDNKGYLFILNKFDRYYFLNSIISVSENLNIKPISLKQIIPDRSWGKNDEKILQNKIIINNQKTIDILPYSITRIYVEIEPANISKKKKKRNN